MEEQIKQIISQYTGFNMGQEECECSAKDITTHVMEFIEWALDNKSCNDDMANAFEKGGYEGIYQYWLDNVKK